MADAEQRPVVLTDARLIAHARAGDAAAFAALSKRHRDRVHRLARQLLRDAEAAEDCVQITFVRAWERLGQLHDTMRFGGWLTTICRSVAANLREAECTHRDREAEAGTAPAESLDRIITRMWIRQALAGLPELYQRPVNRFYFQGWSHRDIAHELRVPVTTVKKHLHDARRRLKEALLAMPAMKKLHGLRWDQRRISHLGAIDGCLDYLGRPLPTGWLFGDTGHAFLLAIHKEVRSSGPTVWEWDHLWRLARNLDVRIEGICTSKQYDPQFRQRQKQAWDLIRDAISRDVPCYGWELAIPEFACIHGYDETGCYFSGPGAGDDAGPKPWRQVGDTGIGLLSVHTAEVSDPAPAEQQVREALQFALHSSNAGEDWHRDYFVGLPGYDAWAKAVEQGTAGRFGQGYNAACWAECRGEAVSFLRQARQRLPDKADGAFDDAMRHYSAVCSCLKAVSALAPFQIPAGEGEHFQSTEAAALLRQAKEAEGKALGALQGIVKAL